MNTVDTFRHGSNVLIRTEEIRTSPVTNLSHTLSLEEGTYRVELTWEPPAPVVQYMIPVTYFVTLFNSSFSTTVHTNQVQFPQDNNAYTLTIVPFSTDSDGYLLPRTHERALYQGTHSSSDLVLVS